MEGTEREMENSKGSAFVFIPEIIFNVLNSVCMHVCVVCVCVVCVCCISEASNYFCII